MFEVRTLQPRLHARTVRGCLSVPSFLGMYAFVLVPAACAWVFLQRLRDQFALRGEREAERAARRAAAARAREAQAREQARQARREATLMSLKCLLESVVTFDHVATPAPFLLRPCCRR